MRRASNDLFDVQLVIFSQIRSMTSRVGTARIRLTYTYDFTCTSAKYQISPDVADGRADWCKDTTVRDESMIAGMMIILV